MKILVPVDFSDCAKAAANVAMTVAKKTGAEICYLHIISTLVDWVHLPLDKEVLYPETKAEIAKAKTELLKLVKKAEKRGLKASQILTFNKGREVIDKHIKKGKYELVVMGSHGATGLKELVGSNTQKVVRYSPVPVLVVKAKPTKKGFRNMVFASHFEKNDLEPFLKVEEIAALLGAKLHLLYVNVPYLFKQTDEMQERMQEFERKCVNGKCTTNIYNALNEESGIQKFSTSINADLIAVTTLWRSGFIKTTSSNIAESLVNHSLTPILAVNA